MGEVVGFENGSSCSNSVRGDGKKEVRLHHPERAEGLLVPLL